MCNVTENINVSICTTGSAIYQKAYSNYKKISNEMKILLIEMNTMVYEILLYEKLMI